MGQAETTRRGKKRSEIIVDGASDKAEKFSLYPLSLGACGTLSLGNLRLPPFERGKGVREDVDAKDRDREPVPVGIKALRMVRAKAARLPILGAEPTVGHVLEEHVIDVSARAIGDDGANRATWQRAGLFESEPIDVSFSHG